MTDLATLSLDIEIIADQLAEAGDLAIKAGARHSSSDVELIQQIYDNACDLCELAEALGADAGMDDEAEDDDETEMGGTAEMKADDVPDVFTLEGGEIKSIGGDYVRGLAVRFGSEDEPDASHMRDYFTKSTQFWIDAWDKRPMLYHHAMEENTADDPIIGTWNKAIVTDEGVWLEGELSKSFKYQTAIKELVRRGALRISTDSAPHLVRRATKGTGAHEVTRWPIICASLTPSAAEPRLSVVSLKSITDELETDTPATDERVRILALELSLLELEA